MKHRRLIIAPILSLLLATGCSNKHTDYEPETPMDNITFEIEFAPQTRVTTDALFKSAWENGDAIGLFAAPAGTQPNASATVHNAKLTYNNGTWIMESPLYWQVGTWDFYAYHPYHPSANDPTAIPFEVKTNQSAPADYNDSHLLMAKGLGCAKGEPVVLSFAHASALVEVTLLNEDETPYTNQATTATLKGVHTSASLNLATQATTITAASTATGLTMNRLPSAAHVYRALVPVQTLAQDASLFQLSNGSSPMFNSPTLDQPINLVGGQAERFTLNIPK